MNVKKVYINKIAEDVDEKLNKLDVVDIERLYEVGVIDSTSLVSLLFEKCDSVESVLIVPTDAPPGTPVAELRSKISVDDAIEYLRRKLGEGKVIAVSDSYECDYIILK